ncbi:MAG: zf-HC2 domain-containing protein [Gemmatimonadaceae bacterium]
MMNEHLSPLLLSMHIDGELSDSDRQLVTNHLAECMACAGDFRRMQGAAEHARNLLQTIGERAHDASDDVLWNRIQSTISSQKQEMRAPRRIAKRSALFNREHFPRLLAAAAMIVVVVGAFMRIALSSNIDSNTGSNTGFKTSSVQTISKSQPVAVDSIAENAINANIAIAFAALQDAERDLERDTVAKSTDASRLRRLSRAKNTVAEFERLRSRLASSSIQD